MRRRRLRLAIRLDEFWFCSRRRRVFLRRDQTRTVSATKLLGAIEVLQTVVPSIEFVGQPRRQSAQTEPRVHDVPATRKVNPLA
jgi:hypothetical protein